ncbi:MAG: hypothetical protein HYZ47_03380 [Simkania negevensis]|nr:hypothetical protein [Simkania negevensis]
MKKNRNYTLERIFQNLSECHPREEFNKGLYVPFYNLGDGGKIDWWIDARHKRSNRGGFYLQYELVHQRHDPLSKCSTYQVFNVLNIHDQIYSSLLKE